MNKLEEKELFELLKNAIIKRFFESNSASSKDISQWKGQDIVSFQDDLFKKSKSTISEKSFYTYFKSEFKKLPRIDMLNILANYAGYDNWTTFVDEKTSLLEEGVIIKKEEKNFLDKNNTEQDLINKAVKNEPQKKITKKLYLLVVSLFILLGLVLIALFLYERKKTYNFCFLDADRNTVIKNDVEVTIQRKGFTPLTLTTKTGCIQFKSEEDTLKMFVSSPYHKKDTFLVNLHQYQTKENINLEPDDYKVMLYYYSRSSKGVKERIEKLNKLIDDNALIYQVYDNEFFGVEILSKSQYINLVSLPTTSLKNYSLIESEMKNGKIVKIKFKIQSNES